MKGQETLDAAKARRGETAKQKATSSPSTALVTTHTPESGYEKPKTLRQLEHIVESNALRGAGFWRKAADALLAIKTEKLWKKARDENDEPYPSFVVYAEERFGFKKTYAYDLVKAAQRKPEAVTEGSARAEMAAERGKTARPMDRTTALLAMQKAWQKFEDRVGDLRDRALEDESFVRAFDVAMGVMGDTFHTFEREQMPIAGEAVEVSPKRENDDLPPGHDDDDSV